MDHETVDVLDKNGQPTGKTATITEACDNGYWHDSVSTIIVSSSGKIAAQKRSPKSWVQPNLLELSVGGFVNAGETCEQAAVREIYEEFGIKVLHHQLFPNGMHKSNHHHPSINKHSKAFVYGYVARISDQEFSKIRPKAKDEVGQIYTLTTTQARQLALRHHLKKFGWLTPAYRHWDRQTKSAQKILHPTVHFICMGNTFRSRLAEAYMKSFGDQDYRVISSGLGAKQNLNGPISYMGSKLIKKHKLEKFTKPHWTQTTQKLIDDSDILVFMSPAVQTHAKQKFDLSFKKTHTWDVRDLRNNNSSSQASKISTQVDKKIIAHVDDLRQQVLG